MSKQIPFAAPQIILVTLAGLVLPLVLIPLVDSIGYSEIIEESAKALVIFLIILKLPTAGLKLQTGILFGFLFGASESIFYLNNIFQLGDFSVFGQRFLLTVPMHIITVLIMVSAGLKNKWFIFFGFAGAIILHLLFNGIVADFVTR